MTITQAIKIFASKAPVCLCKQSCYMTAGDYCGPQKQAHKARGFLRARNISFPSYIDLAIQHALHGEGRMEFDEAMLAFSFTPG